MIILLFDGATFFTFNRNKKYLSLDLRQAEGRKIFEQLVARSDVFFTQTILNGKMCVRFTIASRSTTEDHIRNAWSILQKEGEAALKSFDYKSQDGM